MSAAGRIALALAFLGPALVRAAETIPPPPAAYFNDYAGLVRPETARELNADLEQFERDTSSQIVVAIYPKMLSDSSIEDYTVRVAQAWRVGGKARNNGAVLFVFVQDHRMYIETGYGLEGALPDALCKRILDDQVEPRFRAGDYDGGMRAGVAALMAAAQGEYRGNGQTAAEEQGGGDGQPLWFPLLGLLLLVGWSIARSRQHIVYHGNGRRVYWGGGVPLFFPGGFGGGGSGGGWSGGGGFSGGGGSFGGGGAGGSW